MEEQASQEIGNPAQQESEWPMGARKTVEVNGKRWEYLEYGNPDGIPILNVHGWIGASAEGNELLSKALCGEILDSPGLQNLEKNVPQGAERVKDLVRSLKGKYRIISPQLPGFGHSEALRSPFLDNMADALVDFQKVIGLDKSIFFGSSMGGVLAIKAAARYPDAFRALVLQGTMAKPADMIPLAYIGSRVTTLPPIKMAVEHSQFLQKKLRGIFVSNIQKSKDFKLATPENQELMTRDTEAAEPKTVLSTLRGIGSNLGKEIEEIEIPVVVLDGTAGDLVPIARSKDLAGRFFRRQKKSNRENLRENVAEGRVMYFQIAGVAGEHGHSVINSAPEEVAALINKAIEYTHAGVTRS